MVKTIAHFSRQKGWARLALNAAMLVFMTALSIWAFVENDPLNSRFAEKFMLATAWILFFPVIRDSVAAFKQLVFYDGRLIWAEGGEIVWKSRGKFSVLQKDIVSVVGGFGGRLFNSDTITFKLRDGSERVIETGELRETCDEAVARIRAIIEVGVNKEEFH